jgi:hypothetical protein
MTGLTKRLRELAKRWRRQAPPAVDLDDPQVRLDLADPGWRVRQGDRRRSIVGWATAAEPIEPDGDVYLVEPIVRNADGRLETVHGPLDLDHTNAAGAAADQGGDLRQSCAPPPVPQKIDDKAEREIQKAEYGLTDEEVDIVRDLGLV